MPVLQKLSTLSLLALAGTGLLAHAEQYDLGRCASAEQKQTVREFFAEMPASPPLVVQRILGLSEEIVVSALPSSMAVGTSAEHFEEVSALFETIPGQVQYVIEAADTVTKVFAPITAAHDTVEDDVWYDLISEGVLEGGPGLMIHLRPENLSSIYAIDLPGGEMPDGSVREGGTRAILFFGKDSRSAVGIYVTLVSDGTPESVAAFDDIKDLIASLPDLC